MPDDRERTMADIARQGRKAFAFNGHESGTRHPLVAAAMVLPLAAVLLFLFGGFEQLAAQASSVGVMLGR
ncbi:hypothetical protein ACFV30_31730 [Streptomyces sp. NPDC059752]|uniref:hypothetical protein n=1 Tax=unclassified Streptomyces TaxID=2593676 RepID=UPI00364B3E9C